MYVSVSRLKVERTKVPELIEAFRDRSGLVESAAGFIDLQVWLSDRDPGEVWMVSRWRDRTNFTAYMKSEAHARSHDRIAPEVSGAINLERLEHLQSAFEVVAE